jgi:Putative prokaryotic signal transducing protein
MDELTWELLTETNGRLEADLLKSYLEAYEIPVELFQESVGQHIYPVTMDGLGRVQVFVPKEKSVQARTLLEEFQKPSD